MPATAPRRAGQSGRRLLRLASHIVSELPFLGCAIAEIVRGWRPFGDDAVVAWRSFNVLGGHSPLLGQFSQVTGPSAAHPIYDLGPSQYWLLALPARIDTVHGVLWGSALICVVVAAVAIEAAWSAVGPRGALAVSAVLSVLLATYSALARDPVWNPYFGAIVLVAAIATGWAVSSGDLRWLPALVATVSVSAQAHLVFLAPAGLTGLVALSLGVARTRGWSHRDIRWILISVAVAIALWVAPIIQQLSDRPGNLTLLLHNTGAKGVGLADGLRSIWAFARPIPVWMEGARLSGPQTPSDRVVHAILSGSPAAGIAVLVALLATAVVWTVIGKPQVGNIAVIIAAALLGVALSVSAIPADQLPRLSYLDVALWPVGIATWAVLACSLVSAVLWLIRTAFDRLAVFQSSSPSARPAFALAAALALVAGGVTALVSTVTATGSDPYRNESLQLTSTLATLASRIAPHGPVELSFSGTLPSAIYPPSLVEAVAFRLFVEGKDPRFTTNWQQIGPWILPSPGSAQLVLRVASGGSTAVSVCRGHGGRCVSAVSTTKKPSSVR